MSDLNNKRKRDQFSVTIAGIIIYSIVLIFVMAGTYMGVKSIIKKSETAVEEVQEEVTEEPVQEEIEEEVSQEAEEEPTDDSLDEHTVNVSDICDSNTRYIDYSNTLFSPGERDITLTWQDSVFSRIENPEHPSEAEVNKYDYKRVYGYLLDGTKIVYGIFTNPETDLIEKIRSVAYKGGPAEVITYYYNLGNINYIAQYTKEIDTPINIASSEVTSRYYFNKDTMVKYVYCEGDVATEYVVSDVDTYSKGTVEQYDYLEKEMINSAYITYNIAKALPETELIYGYALDEFNQPMPGAKITLTKNSDGSVAAETEADGDGYYSTEIEVDNDSLYTLQVTNSTLIPVSVYNISAMSGSGEYSVDPIYMSYEGNTQEYNVQILIRDATDMSKALPMASLKFRSGIDNRDGEVVYDTVLNEAGAAIVPIRAGNYTAQVSLGGYEDAYFTVIVKTDHQAILGYAVPDLKEDTFATILSWDTTPLDLDARIISSNAYHILRGASDSIGSTTPEVIYIENAGSDEYEYFVSDYTACTAEDAMSYNMSSSNASVSIYSSDGIMASYHVPLTHGGVVWDAFKIRNGKILPVNDYYYVIEPDSYWTGK